MLRIVYLIIFFVILAVIHALSTVSYVVSKQISRYLLNSRVMKPLFLEVQNIFTIKLGIIRKLCRKPTSIMNLSAVLP